MANWWDEGVQPRGAVPASGAQWWMEGAPGGRPPSARQAQDLGDAIVAGWQNSATGLALRGKLPDQQLGEDAPWYHRLAAGASGVVSDIPPSVAGAVVGSAAGPMGSVAGAFAAPMALRDALVEAYGHNHAASYEGVRDIGLAALKGGTKGAVLGLATAGAGKVVAPMVQGLGKTAQGAAMLGTELTALTTTAAALEGHLPSAQDFMDNALLLGGMKASVGISKKLLNIYAETGKRPEEVLADAARDPKLKEQIAGRPGEAISESVLREKTPVGTPGEKTLSVDGKEVARVEFYRGQGGIRVTKIATEEGARRQGAATRLMDSLLAEFPGEKFDTNMRTDSGRAFFKQYDAGDGTLRPRSAIPDTYAPLALEQRIKAAIDADPRPDMIRRNLSNDGKPPKLGEPPIADPVKYEYITDKDTAVGVLRSVTQMYQTEITAQTRGVVTNKASAVEALRQIHNGEIGKHVIGDAANSAEIYARAHLLKGATNHAVTELQKLARIPEAELSPAAKLQALAALERVSMLKAELEGVGAEAGRALQIFRTIKRDPSYLGEAETLLKLAERKGSLQDIAKYAETLKDPAQMAEFARRYTQATTIEKVQEGWKAAILSGPQTQLANILGNLGKWTLEVPESMLAASLHAAGQKLKGDPLTMAQWKARAFAPFYGIQHGAREALFVAAEVWKGQGERIEKADVYRVAIEGKKGEIIRTPFKLLQVEDALFRTVAERAEAYKMAIDRAVKEGLHPETAEGRAAVVRYTERPELGLTAAAGLKAIEQVQQAGAEAVFAQRLGPRMEIAQRAMAGSALGFVVPFVRTPANLVSWAVQRTPAAPLLSGRWRADFAAGGERAARATARVVIGTGLMVTAYQLAQDGILTGGGMFDKEERRTKTAAGWQAYSIKIGDTHYSYQRMEPVAKVLGLAVDMLELIEKTNDEEDRAKLASMAVLMFGNATISTTYLSGLAMAMQALTDPDRYGEQMLEQYASSLVPKAIGQTVAALDPHKREVDGVMDAIQSQLPYFREKLLPKRDVWGEPAANSKWFDVMPVATSQASQDKVRNEAVRLEIAIADAPRFAMERGPFNAKEKRVELTPEQRDIFRAVSGKNAMEILGPIVNAPDWERLPTYVQVAIYRDAIEKARKQGLFKALPADDPARIYIRERNIERMRQQDIEAQGK